MPLPVTFDPELLKSAEGKTVVVTGGANGIGASTAELFASRGANVVVADLPSSRDAADALIRRLPPGPGGEAAFLPVDILDWEQVRGLFRDAAARFGRVDVVVANAGIMETAEVMDLGEKGEGEELAEPREAYKVLDVNLKGTLNTLMLAMHHMKGRGGSAGAGGAPQGSVVLVASTSGFFGGTGVLAYVASKHGVVGLLRSCQRAARRYGVRVNAVAPFFTPTHITASYAAEWARAGLQANTPAGVAAAVAHTALDPGQEGRCTLVMGDIKRETETTRGELFGAWLGEDAAELMATAGKFFEGLGGYPLPKRSSKL